jgi:hypothetical protein
MSAGQDIQSLAIIQKLDHDFIRPGMAATGNISHIDIPEKRFVIFQLVGEINLT